MSSRRTLKDFARENLPPGTKLLLGRLNTKLQTSLPPQKFAFEDAGQHSVKSSFPFAVDKNNLLEELGRKFEPTKRQHNYLVYYWMHFRDIRLQVRSVLEIGIESGRSLQMWEEFFPNATICGIDINPECQQFEGGRRRVLIGDQSDPEFLRRAGESFGPFDIIIDDGSHRIEHQLKSFELLFPTLSDHGIYVVEDTGGCVDDFGLRTVNSLKNLVDHIMYWPNGSNVHWSELSKFPENTNWISRNIIGIGFYRWIVFVMRGKNPEDNPYLNSNQEKTD